MGCEVVGECRDQGGRHGKSYVPLPPPMFFDNLACPMVNVGHATPRLRSLNYVPAFQYVLEGLPGSGKHVHLPPPLPVPPSDRSVRFPYLPKSLYTRVEGMS